MARNKAGRKSDPHAGELVDATTTIATFVSEGFKRSALVINDRRGGGSVDLVRADGVRLAQVNVFLCKDGTLMVDVIDVDDRYAVKRAISFSPAGRGPTFFEVPEGGSLVACHFEPRKVSLAHSVNQRAQRKVGA